MSDSLQEFKARFAMISRLGQAAGLLGWDQQTYMPSGAAMARAEQMAALGQMLHEIGTSDETGNLLTAAEAAIAGQPEDSDDVRMVRVARREFDKATKLPVALVTEIARHTAIGQDVWARARHANDFAMFAPVLEKMFDLVRQSAECLGYKDHIYDALIENFEPGTTAADVATMFAELKPDLVALTQAIAQSKRPVDDRVLHGDFPTEQQKALTLSVVAAIGYDLTRGRQDIAEHPFCANFSRDDVRITTRFDPKFLNQALYASMHEAGHAMYEQGSPAAYEGTTLSGGASLGVHESQSRLWENLVGRSRAFCHWVYPQLKSQFPDALAHSDAEAFYRAVNKVTPSLIRVEADEVTYNLHTLLRFELECDLLTGTLAVTDLPDAWNARMEAYLGVTPPTNADGVLQDVHWSCGLIGYFPTYSIGNLLSAQLWESATAALPSLNTQIEHGEFDPLLGWLRTNVHAYGSKYLPKELVLKATGKPLSARAYMDYLTAKYTDIYSL